MNYNVNSRLLFFFSTARCARLRNLCLEIVLEYRYRYDDIDIDRTERPINGAGNPL